MRYFFLNLTVVILGLTLAGMAHAGGQGKGSGGSSGGNKSSNQSNKNSPQGPHGNPKNFTMCKYGKCFSKSDFYWTHYCHSSRYGCKCYWFDGCWYVYYQPFSQYIPYTYYVTLVTPVVTATPVVTQTTVTTAVATPVAPAGAGPVLPKPATSGPLPGPGPQ
jgi:hypothetical protein